ncbi:MAG TPA: LytTR family DNA-binding domain-containing protein [Rhodocyclaceae bacterium]|jgi:two-component system response regulator AlgR|nr:LytTR family DNA-binding domain-containing protein [Rhodocyclaceae bacterium]
MTPLKILIVDDEAPARARLRDLLSDLSATLPHVIVAEAIDGLAALDACTEHAPNVVLTDIRMPRMDGLELAQHLARMPQPPGVIFVTAFDQYAVAAFDLAAIDYLLKPIRATRLAAALEKVRGSTLRAEQLQALAPNGRTQLRSTERGRSLLIPVTDILFLRAEQKYVTAHTRDRDYLLEESLSQLEQEFGEVFVRAHRNCLVARKALAGYVRGQSDEEGEGWLLLLHDSAERVPVSRRQWAQIKILLKA